MLASVASEAASVSDSRREAGWQARHQRANTGRRMSLEQSGLAALAGLALLPPPRRSSKLATMLPTLPGIRPIAIKQITTESRSEQSVHVSL